MPNLRGASPIGLDGEGRLYAALAISRGRPNWRRHGRGEILNTEVMMAYSSGECRQGTRARVRHPGAGKARKRELGTDGYYVAYKPMTLSCILFMFIEMKFIHYHSFVMFAMKSMSMCND